MLPFPSLLCAGDGPRLVGLISQGTIGPTNALPPNCQAGDICIAIYSQASTAVTTPPGFTVMIAPSQANTTFFGMAYKALTATDITNGFVTTFSGFSVTGITLMVFHKVQPPVARFGPTTASNVTVTSSTGFTRSANSAILLHAVAGNAAPASHIFKINSFSPAGMKDAESGASAWFGGFATYCASGDYTDGTSFSMTADSNLNGGWGVWEMLAA